MAAALTLIRLGNVRRHLYLFDTFEGMTPPGENDIALDGARAAVIYSNKAKMIRLPSGASRLWTK